MFFALILIIHSVLLQHPHILVRMRLYTRGSVLEEMMGKTVTSPQHAMQLLSAINVEDLQYQHSSRGGGDSDGSSVPVHKVLHSIACVRRAIVVFAELASTTLDVDGLDNDDGDATSGDGNEKEERKTKKTIEKGGSDVQAVGFLQEFHNALQPFLQDQGAACTRSVRMFLLKNLERLRSVSFVRSALQQKPLGTHSLPLQYVLLPARVYDVPLPV